MLLSDIRPYPRNARRNAEDVPKVAESIKAFGFRGQIREADRSGDVRIGGARCL